MPTKIKGTSGIDRVEAGAIITDPTFSGNATVTGTLTVDSNASINGSNISTQPTFRNRIINGNMTIDQRGGTATINATGVTYNVDRWLGRGVASAGVFTLAQDTTSPANFTNSLKATVTTADSSIASGSSYRVQQMVEGYNIANLNWGTSDAQSVSLSFWVRSSVTGTFGGSVANGDYNRFNVFSYTISSANTWEYKTVTIAGDTSGTWVTNNALGLRLNFSLGAGSTLLTSAGSWGSSAKEGVTGQTNVIATNSATFYVTGVQLETGTTATDFENLQYGQQLALCQRYYYATSSAFIAATATTLCYNLQFPVTMRATPTETHTYAGVVNDVYNIITAATPTFVPNGNFPINTGMKFAYDFDAGLTAGQPYQTDFTFSAEL